MDRKDVIEMSKFIVVETTKSYLQSLALTVASFGILGAIGFVWMKIDKFREARKK